MAEAIGLAVSIIAIVNLSAKVAALCLEYSTAVGNARADITRLQSTVDDLGITIKSVRNLLESPGGQALVASRNLLESLDGCTSELAQLQTRLDPGKTRKAMRRFGLRALKWPFDSKEVDDIISNLERYERTITLGLQVDQVTLLLDIRQRIQGIPLQPEEDACIACKPCFSVPFESDPDFVDRPDVLAWMKEQYTGPTSRMALIGMGGFGKSQVAIQFAYHIRDTSPQTSVFWVQASSRLRFEEAYRSIADMLQLPRRNDPSVNVLGLVRDWLQRDEAGPWLMVLDNVDDVNLFYVNRRPGKDISRCRADANPTALSSPQPLASFLPKRHNGKILLTSRSLDAAQKMTGSHKAVRKVSIMDDTQALQLFRNKIEGDFDENAAADLLCALDCIPLAITQAASYINRRAPRISVRAYLDDFRESDKKKGNLLNSDAGDLRRDETVSNSVVTTWQVTFEQIRRERASAADLLSFMSFFNPQGIPEFVLHNYQCDKMENANRDNKDNDEFEDDLDVLRGYSLVSVTATRDACEMHSLVQFCTRSWLSLADDAKQWRRMFLLAMSRHFPSGAFETWPTCQMLLPHIESIVEEEPSETDLGQWTHLLTNVAWYMITTGSYKMAEKLGLQVMETRKREREREREIYLTPRERRALQPPEGHVACRRLSDG